MKDVVAAFRRLLAGIQVTNISFDKRETLIVHERGDILHETRGQVVEADHLIAAFQKMFYQVGTDEAGTAGDQNAGVFEFFRHFSQWMGCWCLVIGSGDEGRGARKKQ